MIVVEAMPLTIDCAIAAVAVAAPSVQVAHLAMATC
jgi:hypothetical protein